MNINQTLLAKDKRLGIVGPTSFLELSEFYFYNYAFTIYFFVVSTFYHYFSIEFNFVTQLLLELLSL